VAVDVDKVDVQVNVEEDATLEVLVVVVVLGILLVVLVVGRLDVVADVVAVEVEVGVVVDVEGTLDELVEGPEVAVVEEPVDRAKYAAAPATAITITMITARKAVAMPLEEACK
jgi:hypothetical protein